MTVERRNTFDDLLSSYGRLVSLWTRPTLLTRSWARARIIQAPPGAGPPAKARAVAQALRLPPAYRLEQDSSLNERDVELLEVDRRGGRELV